MLSRYSLILGSVLIWASVIVIPYGTYLQPMSPHFAAFEQHILADAEALARDPEKDFGPGIGIGLGLYFAWLFWAVFCAGIGMLFIFGVLLLRSMISWNRDLALVASGIFLSGCFVGSLMGSVEAIDKFQWGFFVLGVGFLHAAAGFFLVRSVR